MIAFLTDCFVQNRKNGYKRCDSRRRSPNNPPQHLTAEELSTVEPTTTGCRWPSSKHNENPNSSVYTQDFGGASIPAQRCTAAQASALAPGQANSTDEAILRARDAMVVNSSPAMITILTKDGTVLYQNRQSKAYFGDRSTATPFDLETRSLLTAVFELEPQKLIHMSEEIKLPGGSGRWKGILRVPVSLNAAKGSTTAADSAAAAFVRADDSHLCGCESGFQVPSATGGLAAAMTGAGFTAGRNSFPRGQGKIAIYLESPPPKWPDEGGRDKRHPGFAEDARGGGGTGTCEDICGMGGLTGGWMLGHDADTAPHSLLCLDEDAELAMAGLDGSLGQRAGYAATDNVGAAPAAFTSPPCMRWSETAPAAACLAATTAAATAVATATTAITDGHSSLILAHSMSYSRQRWIDPTAAFDSRPSAQRPRTAHGYSLGINSNGGGGCCRRLLYCAHSAASVPSACNGAAPKPPRPGSTIPSQRCPQLCSPQRRMGSSLLVPNSSNPVGEAPGAVNDPLATSSFATLLITSQGTQGSLAGDIARTGTTAPVVPLARCNHHHHQCDQQNSSKVRGNDGDAVVASHVVETLPSIYGSAPTVSCCRSPRPYQSTVSSRSLHSSMDSRVACMATSSPRNDPLAGRTPSALGSRSPRPPPTLPRSLAFAMSLGTSPLATVAGGSGWKPQHTSPRQRSMVGSSSITAALATDPMSCTASKNGFSWSVNGRYDGVGTGEKCFPPPAVAVTKVMPQLPPPQLPTVQSTPCRPVTPMTTAHPFACLLNSPGCAGSAGVDDTRTELCNSGGVLLLDRLLLPQPTSPQGLWTQPALETTNLGVSKTGRSYSRATVPFGGVMAAMPAVLRCVRGLRRNAAMGEATGARVTDRRRTVSSTLILECDTTTGASGASVTAPPERPLQAVLAAGPGLGLVLDSSPAVPQGVSKRVVGPQPAPPSSPPPLRMSPLQQPYDMRTPSPQQLQGRGTGQQHQQQQYQELEEPVAVEEKWCRGMERWHECWAVSALDPLTGSEVIVLTQSDITAKVIAERHLALVMETEHRLVEQLFPRHILQYITEEWTAAHHTEKGQVEAGAGGGGGAGGGAGGGGAGYVPGTDSSRGPGCSAGGSLRWRPVVRDCNALATWHPEVTLLFADIQGFTSICEKIDPQQVMMMLNQLYSRYDAMLDKYGVYKVETIGDCYFVAGGLIHEDEDGMAAVRQGDSTEDPLHAEKIFMFAKAMFSAAREVVMPTTGQPVQIRIGLHTGPVVSGVVGTRMPRFCLFGDTVNTASRMESTGVPGAIHASEATYNRLSKSDQWETTGGIEVKGKGFMQTYLWRPCSTIAGAEDTASAANAGDAAIAADITTVPADPNVPADAANLSTSASRRDEKEVESYTQTRPLAAAALPPVPAQHANGSKGHGAANVPYSLGLTNPALDRNRVPFPVTQILDSSGAIWQQVYGESSIRDDLVAQAHCSGCSGASNGRLTEPSFSGLPT
ncbi:hypothetical protein Vafri_15263 [Volvox africanus]|uniref:Guanylate cyclase domain-containing protein n=1 Tax=Volvox africanus TaxID=51714 RepID=A0A8J4BGJ0_9CHLO|nr:hypothetical protein Vafri_15263 [Volvox africanus]